MQKATTAHKHIYKYKYNHVQDNEALLIWYA